MLQKIKLLLRTYYGLEDTELTKMEGYESINYKVRCEKGCFVLKVYRYEKNAIRMISTENEVLRYLESNSKLYPKVIPNQYQETLTYDPSFDAHFFYRLLSYLEGEFMANSIKSDAVLMSFGQTLGALDMRLKDLHPIEVMAKKIPWDLDHFLMNESLVNHINNHEDKKLVQYFFLQYKEHVWPHLYSLRKSLIYNDANDWNVLIQSDQISGIIDFGDMVYSSTINELAIGITYALMNEDDLLNKAKIIVHAYNSAYLLKLGELKVLYYLIAARLCTSVCQSAQHKKINPESDYITISEKGAWRLLQKWLEINPYKAFEEFVKCCDLSFELVNTTSQIVERRALDMGKSLSVSYQRPIHMIGAAFQYMYDAEGNTILDAYNNIIQVGHCHPHVVVAGQRTMAKLNTNTRYLYDELAQYSELLLKHFPSQLNKVFFVNSGSAASDLAIRMAMTHTSHEAIAVIKHGYHGNSRLGIDISHYKYNHKGGTGKKEFIIETEMPDTYRGQYRDTQVAGRLYANDFIENLSHCPDLAAFIAEPIVGCGGQVPLADGYLSNIYPEIRRRGGVCISDEVQVGFGRLGSHFWGFEMHSVIPDVVILGKPIGNGHPMAAVVCTQEIAESFANGMEFFSSFGGNPVSCAIGKAVLEVIESENLQANALQVGNYLSKGLNELSKKHSSIGDVRGSGLFIGVDMVEDALSRRPNTLLAQHIKNELRERNILVGTDGPFDNVIKIKPPLCFSFQNSDILLNHLDDILDQYNG